MDHHSGGSDSGARHCSLFVVCSVTKMPQRKRKRSKQQEEEDKDFLKTLARARNRIAQRKSRELKAQSRNLSNELTEATSKMLEYIKVGKDVPDHLMKSIKDIQTKLQTLKPKRKLRRGTKDTVFLPVVRPQLSAVDIPEPVQPQPVVQSPPLEPLNNDNLFDDMELIKTYIPQKVPIPEFHGMDDMASPIDDLPPLDMDLEIGPLVPTVTTVYGKRMVTFLSTLLCQEQSRHN